MKKVVSSQAVTHLWAHRQQESARNSNGSLYFYGDTIFSYGAHFPIARHLDSGAIAVTTGRYSATTDGHVALVRRAIPDHEVTIFVDNPRMPADAADRDRAEGRALSLLASASKRRSPALKDNDQASALGVAMHFNLYAQAVGSSERIALTPIAEADLAAMRLSAVRREQLAAADARRDQANADARLAEQVKRWRNFEPTSGHDIRNASTALRMYRNSVALGGLNNMFIETSRGAVIPATDAARLWPIIRRVMDGERDYEVGMKLGAYRLTQIRQDGSIVVGCHDIAFAEIERIAEALALVQTEVAA